MSDARGNLTMTEALRKALTACEESLRAAPRGAGVPVCSLSRFAAGKQSLRLDMADRLAEYFGIAIELPARGSGKRGE
jgi:plasmid maintenance system antidote protein VapI